jgi:hypothetical protein
LWDQNLAPGLEQKIDSLGIDSPSCVQAEMSWTHHKHGYVAKSNQHSQQQEQGCAFYMLIYTQSIIDGRSMGLVSSWMFEAPSAKVFH